MKEKATAAFVIVVVGTVFVVSDTLLTNDSMKKPE